MGPTSSSTRRKRPRSAAQLRPVKNGNEDLCNPPARGLGIRDTTDNGLTFADADLWTHLPGSSSGCGGGQSAGVFWAARAESEASHANDQLGPGFPSELY